MAWQLAAAEPHIHKQALAYRFGESNNSPAGIAKNEHLAEWWLALRAVDG